MKLQALFLLMAIPAALALNAQTMNDYYSSVGEKVQKDTPQLPKDKSKAVLIDESFEGDEMPEDWTIYQLAENGTWTLDLGLGNTGDHSLKHAQVEAEADNWFVSPRIYINADNYLLSFYEFAAQWEDNSCNLHISDGSGDPVDGDFELEATYPATTWWTYHEVDLSAYEGDSIYIGFQAISVSAGYSPQWRMDDIYVAPSEFTDGGIVLTAPTGYNPNTGEENIKLMLENFGTETFNLFSVDWWVDGEQQDQYTGTAPVNPGNVLELVIGSYNFDEEANYTIEAELIVENDDDSTNNYTSIQYSVGLSNDLSILSFAPTGNSPKNGYRDLYVEFVNNGTSNIYEFDVEWEIDGTPMPTYQASGLNVAPGESYNLQFEDHFFAFGVYEITIHIPIDFDLTSEDNTIEDVYAVGGLYEDFQGNYPPDQWQVHFSLKSNFNPPNNDPDDFYAETMSGANSFGSATDTTWTPLLDIELGDELSLIGSGGGCQIVWKDGTTGSVSLLDSPSFPGFGWESYSVDLSPAEGVNYIGLVNAASQWAVINFDDIVSTAPIYTYDNDLALFDQYIEFIEVTGTPGTISCRVKNIGDEEVSGSDYSVKLMDNLGATLVSIPGVDIEEFESRMFEFSYTFINQGNYEVYVAIDFAMDERMQNNSGELIPVHAAPSETQFPTTGAPDYVSLEIPFNTMGWEGFPSGTDDFSQVLYYSDEIGTPGMIHGVKYYYQNIAAYGSVAPLQVWLTTTDIEEFDGENWYPQDDFQLVFDDTIYTTAGDGYVYIQFPEPFVYDGTSNLIVQHHCYDPSFLFALSRFMATESYDQVRVNVKYDWHEIDLENLPWPFATRTDYPYTTFVIDPLDDIGVVSGVVFNENNEPVSGALITVEGTTIEEVTTSDGSYTLPPLSYGPITVVADKYGYDYGVETIDLNGSSYQLDFYLEPRPLIEVTGHVVGSNDNSVPLEDVLVVLDGYAFYPTGTDDEGNFVYNNVYGNVSYQITLDLYGYETYIDTVELEDVNLDLGTLIMQEAFIPAAIVQATDNDTEALIEWVDPGATVEDYLINDMGADLGGLANSPYEEVWLGNRFENPGTVTLTDTDLFFTFDEGGVADSVTVDVFNEAGEVIARSEPFMTPWYDWVYLDLPNMTITGDYYIMVHWKNNENTTHFLCYDYDWTFNMPNTAYIKYPDSSLVLLGEYYNEEPPFSFWVRAHVLASGDGDGGKAATGYNIYRGFASEIQTVGSWMQLNLDPITETNYTDDTWPPIGVNTYMYAVEAIYTETDAEVTFSNSLDGGIVGVNQSHTGYSLFPNPVREVLEIRTDVHIRQIRVINGMGQTVMVQSPGDASVLRVDMQELDPGVYYIRAETEQGLRTHKVIKQ